MTIESSEVTINRNNGSELKRRIKDVHTTQTAETKSYNRDVSVDLDAISAELFIDTLPTAIG